MKTTNRAPISEVWMQLTDRKKLAKLMTIQEVSQRQLAEAAGWKSHSYMGRLMRGEVNTLDTDAAARISKFLGVGVDDLFVVRVSSSTAQNRQMQKAG